MRQLAGPKGRSVPRLPYDPHPSPDSCEVGQSQYGKALPKAQFEELYLPIFYAAVMSMEPRVYEIKPTLSIWYRVPYHFRVSIPMYIILDVVSLTT